MNKVFWILGLSVLLVGTIFLWPLVDPVRLYSIQPSSIIASGATTSHHHFDETTQILTVNSKHKVIVVADPSQSFHYNELWLVEIPQTNSNEQFSQFTFKVSDAQADHIHGIDSHKPQHILAIANSTTWQ